ncbi:titin homolog [Cyprinodon tularosa]|uniref:titin homolog n=1 Tax=Cyprinodon tularosa TaxID=77115 RepID=UPI0018E283E3|nr:titin homolog [Cyprinodon tularosa]
MGSRRTMVCYSFGNGRSSNGNDVRGRSRSSSFSYLSNLRPENRSTFCSVMAQLAEEMQPSFVTTLKSKAVSENSNVKFTCVVTGHPVPQVTWYKDDKQLDRFCGLPKYEIFHNGQNHSLHIHNCTVDDAAIYQASATNSKGIVSCSGVLEVGEMNEFKIHQRYFAKLKQKAENKCRQTQGKENLEPLRTISPDRTQRKRRSTMEAFVSTPNSIEDESNEAEGLQTECRLHEGTVEEVYKTQASDTKETTSAEPNGQINSDPENKSRTYTYDPDHKTFSSHQPKSPFVMKKIKISNNTTHPKPEKAGERNTIKNHNSFISPVCAKNIQTNGNPEEIMEVENILDSSLSHAYFKKIKGESGQLAKEEAMFVKNQSKDENIFHKRTVSSQRDNLTTSESSAATSPKSMFEKEGKKIANHKNEGSYKDTEKCLERQNQVPHVMPAQNEPCNKLRLLSIKKEDIDKAEHVRALDIEVKSNTLLDGSGCSKQLDTSCNVMDVSPQCSYGRGTGPITSILKILIAFYKHALFWVTEADGVMNGNDAPVGLKLPLNQHNINPELPQKTDHILTSPLSGGPHPSPDGIAQDTSSDSRKPNEGCTAIFTHPQKSAHRIPGHGESILDCTVLSVTQQSQLNTAIKTFEGTKIQDEKIETGEIHKVAVQAVNGKSSVKILEMEAETSGLHGQNQSEKTKDEGKKDSEAKSTQIPIAETKKNQSTLKVLENTNLHHKEFKSGPLETQKQTLEKTEAPNGNIIFRKIPKHESKVISVAELLRSQIKALELGQSNPVSTMSAFSNSKPDSMINAKGVGQEARNGAKINKPDRKTFKTKTETEEIIGGAPHSSLKETLIKVYQELNEREQEQNLTSDETSKTARPSHQDVVVPSISFSVNDTATDITLPCRKVEDVMDTSRETVVSFTDKSNVKDNPHSLPSENGFIKEIQSISNPPVTSPLESRSTANAENNPQDVQSNIMENSKDGTVQGPKMMSPVPQLNLNNKLEVGITVSEQHKMEEPPINSTQKLQTYLQSDRESKKNLQVKDILLREESSVLKEGLRPDPFNSLTPESSLLIKNTDFVSEIPSATPQELASGARRKITASNAKTVEAQESTSPSNSQTQKKEISVHTSTMSPSLSRRSALLQPAEEQTSVVKRQSPLLTRRKMASETQTQSKPLAEKIQPEGTSAEKDKHNPFKAPQVIRKIRGETFADGSGHLKLWCQFFNVLSDSNIKWDKNEEEIAQVTKSAGDETQVNLAIVQASCKDSGVYGCTITNEYGSDSTDFLLSADILAGMSLREDLGVGEEIEMTPLIFNKGLADSGVWGNKFFGRIMITESRIGDGCSHKVWRAKVIYGLEPVFDSGNTCIIKVHSPVIYGGKVESSLIERNLHLMKQECRIQNLAREYCKIFAAEARIIENFGPTLEVIPLYLMYRPANPIPYATVETDLIGVYKKYTALDNTGRTDVRTGSEVELKCCALQHWIFQWTSGNFLITRLEGVDTKITNVNVSVKTTGYLGLSIDGNPKVFDQFVLQHRCNYFCGLLGLKSLKVIDSLSMPARAKGSKSPLLQRKKVIGSSSPQTTRKAAGSPRIPRKAEHEDKKTHSQEKDSDASREVNKLQT